MRREEMRWDEIRRKRTEEKCSVEREEKRREVKRSEVKRSEEKRREEKRREEMINIESENNIDYIDRSDYDPNTNWSRMQSYWENKCGVDQCVETFKKRWL